MQPNNKCFRSKDQSEQLFPRLPNEITFCRIVPKLPWRAFHILSAVSLAWRKAIQNHQVYDARIHSCSTDTLVVHAHNYSKNDCNTDRDFTRIAVYSVRDKLCYNLPPIPGHSRGIPSACECVSLDGKIYILGGVVEVCVSADAMKKRCSYDSSSKVYVLDLAGASHWKECASMERGRRQFGCGVIDGKIYVFGGTHDCGPVRGAEVYNPKVNAWSPIMPMASLRFGHKVLVLAEKIVVYGGQYYDTSYTGWKAHQGQDSTIDLTDEDSFVEEARFLEVYDPVEDAWAVDTPFSEDDYEFIGWESLFLVEGKFHLMHEDGVYVYDDFAGKKSWKLLKANSFPRIGHIGYVEDYDSVSPIDTVVLNDELLAGVEWADENNAWNCGSALLGSNGFRFGTENNRIVWKVVSKCPVALDFMYCIQL